MTKCFQDMTISPIQYDLAKIVETKLEAHNCTQCLKLLYWNLGHTLTLGKGGFRMVSWAHMHNVHWCHV